MNIKATKLTPPRNVSIRRKNKIHFSEVTCKKTALGLFETTMTMLVCIKVQSLQNLLEFSIWANYACPDQTSMCVGCSRYPLLAYVSQRLKAQKRI